MSGGGMSLEQCASVRFVLLLAFPLIACRPPGYGKGDDVQNDPVDAAPADTAVTETDGSTASTCDKAFRLDGHSTANTVWLTGSFIEWAADPPHGAVELAKGVDGAWTGSYDLAAGPHQYKFIVNGNNWIIDPTNPNQIDDGFGGTNSVVTCTP
jgi:hypothetical protein